MSKISFTKKKRYSIAPQCPCGKSNKDGKFIPFEINGIPQAQFGRCFSCGKIFYPNTHNSNKSFYYFSAPAKETPKIVPLSEMTKTLNNYHQNSFIKWLKIKLPNEFLKAAKIYRVGTSNYNRTLFWYIDHKGFVRNAKSVLFNADGKRTKSIYSLYKRDDGYNQCLFGEHLLNRYPMKNIVLVESEKTAIVGSIVFYSYLWIGLGGANALTNEKVKVLSSKKLLYIPDCDEAGKNSIDKISKILKTVNVNFTVIDYFFKYFKDGEDIVDILLTNKINLPL